MRRLLASELLSFRSRRLVVILVGAAIGGSAVGALVAAWQSAPPTEEVRAAAEAQAERELRLCLGSDFDDTGEIPGSLEDFCRENMGDPTNYMPPHVALADLPEILEGISSLTSILGLVVGASVLAASWQSGTIGTIFTWEPRRMRWFAARLLVLGSGVFAITVAIVAFLSGALAIAAALRGSTILTEGWWADGVATGLRVASAAATAALIGAAVAAVGRHTAAALGVVFVYTAVLEGLIRAYRPRWSPWLLGDNLVSFLSWRATEFQVSTFESYSITPGRASFVILGYTTVVLALGFTFIRLRDVQ